MYHFRRHELEDEAGVLPPTLDGFLDEGYDEGGTGRQRWVLDDGIHQTEEVNCKPEMDEYLFFLKKERNGKCTSGAEEAHSRYQELRI